MTREAILDSIVRDWTADITRPDCYEAMKIHAIDFAKWINKNCQIWGDRLVYANGNSKDYDADDLYEKFIEQQNKP